MSEKKEEKDKGKKDKDAGVDIIKKELRISREECEKTIAAIEAREKTQQTLGLCGAIVLVAKDKICYLNKDDSRVRLQADAELIARITWLDDEHEMGLWRWGYTIESFKSALCPKKEFKGEWAWMNSPVVAVADIAIETMIRRCQEEHKYELTQDARLGPRENERYIFGLRNVLPCTTASSIIAGASGAGLREISKAVHDKALPDDLPATMATVRVE